MGRGLSDACEQLVTVGDSAQKSSCSSSMSSAIQQLAIEAFLTI